MVIGSRCAEAAIFAAYAELIIKMGFDISAFREHDRINN
jgi:hypothetical protein